KTEHAIRIAVNWHAEAVVIYI
ncbi:hypothetical protein AZZ66_003904, partial [Escherichia coli]